MSYVCAGEVVRVYVSLKTAPDGGGGGQRGGIGARVGGRKRGGAEGARGMSDRCGALSTSHCELEPCLVGGWERGRITGCLGGWYHCGLGRD